MTTDRQKDTEALQRLVARYVATHPAGRYLPLIGGFRYRFLDESVRTSADIDYHWSGELSEKQEELIQSFRRSLLSEVSSRLGYLGSIDARVGPDADSPVLRVVELSFWKENVPYSRIEIPVEVTRIACADPVEVRTAGGTVYATVSDADMIESKLLALFGRIILQHRDIVDLFLFQNSFLPESLRRIESKLSALKIDEGHVNKKLRDLLDHADYHTRAIQEVIDSQLDSTAAAQLNDSGGGRMVLDAVIRLLHKHVSAEGRNESN